MILFFCSVNRPKEVIFAQVWSLFVFCTPKGRSLKSLFSSYSVFFLVFLLSVFPFKIPFSLFLSSNPLWETFGGITMSLFFSFVNVCLFFETNFPNIPFLKPKLLSCLAVSFFLLFYCFCFHGVCFCLSVFMLALLLICFFLLLFSLCFSFVFCFAFRQGKTVLPCSSSVFVRVMLAKR